MELRGHHSQGPVWVSGKMVLLPTEIEQMLEAMIKFSLGYVLEVPKVHLV